MMKIAVFGAVGRPAVLSCLNVFLELLKGELVSFSFEKGLYAYASEQGLSLDSVSLIANDDFDADLALSIGGDGTFLTTAAHIGQKDIPVLGVNTGRLGFLTDVSEEDIRSAIDFVLRPPYPVEERSLLALSLSGTEVLPYPYALNEVAVLKQDSSSMLAITLTVNGERVHTYQSDGLIVATPTGSTAYSMSVGGPIVVPQARTLVVSPVASHSLNVRPLIIPDNWPIELEVDSRTGSFLLAVDGRSQVLDQQLRVKISKADHSIKIVKQPGHTFFTTLRNKLMWGLDKRN